jgi:hypothetical protein
MDGPIETIRRRKQADWQTSITAANKTVRMVLGMEMEDGVGRVASLVQLDSSTPLR